VENRNAYRILTGNILESGQLEDQKGDGNTALRRILGKQDVRAGGDCH
jgi:hypothetical protein